MNRLDYKNKDILSINGELGRKLIHYFSSAIPIGYYYLDKEIPLYVLIFLLISMLLVELLKYKNDLVYHLYMKYFGDMLREHEYDRTVTRVNGATWVILSFILCILIFPKFIAITGMLILSFADSSSALIGRFYGRRKFAPNRSYIGTLVFIITGIVVVLLAPKYSYSTNEYLIGFAALVFTTIADAMNLPVDDNFTIPIVYCSAAYILYNIFLPGLFYLTVLTLS